MIILLKNSSCGIGYPNWISNVISHIFSQNALSLAEFNGKSILILLLII